MLRFKSNQTISFSRMSLLAFVVMLFCIGSYAQFPHKIFATKEQIQNFFGTNKVKLVFVQYIGSISTIYFIDFTEATPQVRKLVNNTSHVSLPVISPDGNWVVYRVGEEEETEKCPLPASAKVMLTRLAAGSTPIEIANIGYSPRFDYRVTEANKIGIIYPNGHCNGAAGGDLPHQGGVKTVRKIVDISGSIPNVGPEEVIYANGAYNAGISKDGKYLAAQYPGSNVYMLNTATNQIVGLNKFSVKNCATSKDTFITSNVCNGSISSSKSRPDAVLFYTGPVSKRGYCSNYGSWGDHKALVVRSFENEILSVIQVENNAYCPQDEIEVPKGCIQSTNWKNPEWSNHPYFATSSLEVDRLFTLGRDSNGSLIWDHIIHSEKVMGVDLRKGKTISMIETSDTTHNGITNMVTPWLWVSTDGFEEDSNFLKNPISVKKYSKNSVRNLQYSFVNNTLCVNQSITEIRIYNSIGKKVWSCNLNNKVTNSVVLPLLTRGIYIFEVKFIGPESSVSIKWNSL